MGLLDRYLEPAMTLGSGAAGMAVAPLAAAGAALGNVAGLPYQHPLDAYTQAIDAATYSPRTPEGQEGLQDLGQTMQDLKLPPYLGGGLLSAAGRLAPAATTQTAGLLAPVAGDMADNAMSRLGYQLNAAPPARINKKLQTVNDPQRNAFPGIYGDPRVIAAQAYQQFAPESPHLQDLFGVSREQLYNDYLAKLPQAVPGVLPGAAATPKGSAAATSIMTRRNAGRLGDVLDEMQQYPDFLHGMGSWYNLDPLHKALQDILPASEATARFNRLNTLTGMASPASAVDSEITRGSFANVAAQQGDFPSFLKYGGKAGQGPDWLDGNLGHAYHSTAHAPAMDAYLRTGAVQLKEPKVATYIQSSSLPGQGFQADIPVGDAHWSRAVGLADTRDWSSNKGQIVVPGASVSTSEIQQLAPWWRDKVAAPAGLASVPAHAIAWGAFSPQTGVKSMIGAPKLELIANQIANTAKKTGLDPRVVRDEYLKGNMGITYQK